MKFSLMGFSNFPASLSFSRWREKVPKADEVVCDVSTNWMAAS
jgi:hypothetical protein